MKIKLNKNGKQHLKSDGKHLVCEMCRSIDFKKVPPRWGMDVGLECQGCRKVMFYMGYFE